MTAASPLPPNFVFPKFDGTLGALYIGSGVATILYGVGCLQTFTYVTGSRGRQDRQWLRVLVWFLFSFRQALNTAEQAAMMAGMYRFLVSDFLNPLALPSGGPGSAEVYIYAESVLLACISVLIQWFFCWRIWAVTASTFGLKSRITFTVLTLSLSIFSFATYIDLAINGFNHKILTGNTPDFILAFKLATSSQIVYDVFVTGAMTWSLQRARIGIKRTDHVVKLIMLFTINTNLLSTVLSISGLITFLALPRATVYGGIGFLLGKTYFNSFLAVLNAREYLLEKFDHATGNGSDGSTMVSYPRFVTTQTHNQDVSDTIQTTMGLYEMPTRDTTHEPKLKNEVVITEA